MILKIRIFLLRTLVFLIFLHSYLLFPFYHRHFHSYNKFTHKSFLIEKKEEGDGGDWKSKRGIMNEMRWIYLNDSQKILPFCFIFLYHASRKKVHRTFFYKEMIRAVMLKINVIISFLLKVLHTWVFPGERHKKSLIRFSPCAPHSPSHLNIKTEELWS